MLLNANVADTKNFCNNFGIFQCCRKANKNKKLEKSSNHLAYLDETIEMCENQTSLKAKSMKAKQTKIKTKSFHSQANKHNARACRMKWIRENFIKTKLSTSYVYLKSPSRDLIYSSNNREV